jgi:hypothetical protein
MAVPAACLGAARLSVSHTSLLLKLTAGCYVQRTSKRAHPTNNSSPLLLPEMPCDGCSAVVGGRAYTLRVELLSAAQRLTRAAQRQAGLSAQVTGRFRGQRVAQDFAGLRVQRCGCEHTNDTEKRTSTGDNKRNKKKKGVVVGGGKRHAMGRAVPMLCALVFANQPPFDGGGGPNGAPPQYHSQRTFTSHFQ